MAFFDKIGKFLRGVLDLPKTLGGGMIRAVGRQLMSGLTKLGGTIREIGSAVEKVGFKYSEPDFSDDLRRATAPSQLSSQYAQLSQFDVPGNEDMVEVNLRHGMKYRITGTIQAHNPETGGIIDKPVSMYSNKALTTDEMGQMYLDLYMDESLGKGYLLDDFSLWLLEHQKGMSY